MSLKDPYWPSVKKHIHVLGILRWVVHGTGRIRALYLFEKSLCRGDEPAELPPARVEAMIGACSGIRCTICGEIVDWTDPAAESYARLMGHYPRAKDV